MRHRREAADPRQFSVMDLFAMTSVAALLFAMAAPIVQRLQKGTREELLLMTIFQVTAVGITIAYAAQLRGKLLASSGRRMGRGYCGTIHWKRWPAAKSILVMVSLAVGQLAVALLVVTSGSARPFAVWIYHLQLAVFTGFAVSRYLWRVYPGSIEFFENGIALGGAKLIPWQRVELRSSQFFADRLVLVVRPAAESISAITLLAQVSEPLRRRLRDRISEQTTARR